MWKFGLNCDFREPLRIEEGLNLAVDVGVDTFVLVHNVSSQNQSSRSESPGVKFMKSQDTGKFF